MIEKAIIDVFKVDGKLFFTEESAQEYMTMKENTINSSDIMRFLVENEYNDLKYEKNVVFTKKIGYKTHRFNFIGVNFIYYGVCNNTNEVKPKWSEIQINLCDIESFTIFYNNVLKL